MDELFRVERGNRSLSPYDDFLNEVVPTVSLGHPSPSLILTNLTVDSEEWHSQSQPLPSSREPTQHRLS